MSSDAFGLPVRKYDFGRGVGLAGQALVTGAQYKMQQHIVWSRGDTVTCAAGVNVYLPFDVPPLPPGAIIRATVGGSLGANDLLAIGASGDWLVAAPTVTQVVTAALPAGAIAGLTLLQMVLRTRTTWRGASLNCEGTGLEFNGSGVDFGRSQRLAVYADETAAIVLQHATVEVFIPRVYR